jgi:hypothetical protein
MLLRDPKAELVFGLVAPVGADLETLEQDLANQLRHYGYTPNPIRVSKLIKDVRDLDVELKEATEYERLVSFMDGGNRLREQSTLGATLFSTTFPCHNCAKHIIASGIRRVVLHRAIYEEPGRSAPRRCDPLRRSWRSRCRWPGWLGWQGRVRAVRWHRPQAIL